MKKKMFKTVFVIVAACSLTLNAMLGVKVVQQYKTYDHKINNCVAVKKEIALEITDLKTQIDTKDATIKTLEESVATLNKNIASLQSEISSLKKN